MQWMQLTGLWIVIVLLIMTPEQIAGDSEHSQQAALMCWAATNTHKYPELQWLFAIPNGEARSAITGARLKASGVRSGVWDLTLQRPSPEGWHGLWIEMKVGKGKLSATQVAFGEFVKSQGYFTAVCYSWEDAKIVIETYLKY